MRGASAFESHDVILRLIAIAEEFSAGLLIDAIEILLPKDAAAPSKNLLLNGIGLDSSR